MKLAKNAFVIALTMLTLVFTMSAQTLRPEKDDRNTAPTVGTGGPPGGPTGLFTIYDGSTLRAGEFTFSAAWSNYDRDPGNVDINEVPVSFQVGLNDYIELFFNTDAYRAIKVNSPRNLSGFYLPNTRLRTLIPTGTPITGFNGGLNTVPSAIVLGNGILNGQNVNGLPVFLNNRAFVPFPFIGIGNGGSGSTAANFPGVGSIYGSILPGIVLQTTNVGTATQPVIVPSTFTNAPTYLPDAPFVNRQYSETAFSTFTVGTKIRFTGPNNPYGIGLIPFYRFYGDKADNLSGFNQLQRGASPGGNRGDFGLVLFGDARLAKYINVSANLGYIYNSSVKTKINGTELTLLDRPDEVISGIGVDFPVNKYFQPILEFRSTQYVGGRTPNAFENSPIDGLAGARVYPTRYLSLGAAYRYNFNQQDRGSFDKNTFRNSATVTGANGGVFSSSFSGVPPGFVTSTDPNGFIVQASIGRRNARKGEILNKPANVTNLALGDATVNPPCPPGFRPKAGQNCSDDQTVTIATTAVDPENDVLTYNYTVSGGRIVGTGANVSWDLTGAQPGTYTITAGVDDSCGVCGQTQTKTITVAACDCEKVCDCPTLSVTGPAGVTGPGETMTFTANVSGGSGEAVTYNWSVSAGTIVEGQGTPVIKVATTPEMAGGNVTATVDIGGVCEECLRTKSETGVIDTIPKAEEIDDFGKEPNDQIKSRLDAYFSRLQNNPSAQGYIFNYGATKDVVKREKLIRDYITFRSQDASRFTFVRGEGADIRTRLVLVPSGAVTPTP